MADGKKKSQSGVAGRVKDRVQIAAIVLLCVAVAVLEFVPVVYTEDEVRNRLLSDCIPLLVGSVAVIWLMARGGSGLFGRPVRLLWFLPCLVIALDNFPLCSYLAGKSQLYHTGAADWALFALYCAGVGVFEECVFRGILFPLMAARFSADRKGFLKTYFLSSVIFGGMHLFNLFSGGGAAAVLQAGYSTLTGGLFAYALIKTKNIFLCAFAHGLYDFCGLMFQTLGGGTVFDLPTVAMMTILSVAVAAFVLYAVFTYPESERKLLYSRLGFGADARSAEIAGPEATGPEGEKNLSSGDEK